jgi:hypothetical protein
MIAAVHSGAAITAGIDHPAYTIDGVILDPAVRDSLANDLESAAIN